MGYSDIEEHLWVIEGSDSSDWEHCQERFPLLPKGCLQCVNYFSLARLSLLLGSWETLVKAKPRWRLSKGQWTQRRWDHSHSISMPGASGPYHLCCCSAAWSDTSWCQCLLGTSLCLERKNLSPHLQMKRTVPPPPSVQLPTLCQETWGAHVWVQLALSCSVLSDQPLCQTLALAESPCPVPCQSFPQSSVSLSFFRETLGGHTSVCLTAGQYWSLGLLCIFPQWRGCHVYWVNICELGCFPPNPPSVEVHTWAPCFRNHLFITVSLVVLLCLYLFSSERRPGNIILQHGECQVLYTSCAHLSK